MAESKKLMTPVFRVSFPAVANPESMDDGPMKYGVSAVFVLEKFTAKDKQRWKALHAALDQASKEKFKKAWKDLPANFKKGLRDGEERSHLEGFGAGTMFANLTTKSRPGVVDKDGHPLDPNAIYAGCWCRATVGVYSYDNRGKGVAIGLNNLQFIADGPRLDGRTNAEDDFAGEGVDDEWLEQDEGDDGPDPLD